ncbi:hypothetical protein CORC01_05338 [Colletotrichum orchidophilum]|uniref:BHLH domain-containing protein n=1 Tax=Colletotrichum orchidophilum TaxID=1209926 RepID=A0A1G4BD57_9PEZI|nr:uncharacterized protein CORC01_05338 [Colletotrichum orchidophilum]OHE99297.1 hypothetical protein CORC01_05338 [Colletotrichum orchidophilum]
MNMTALGTVFPGPTTPAPLPENIPGKKSTKKRIRNFSADDRAAHRIFERGRREAFKERLTELAGQLPVLADTDPERLSKHVVVNQSIARHKLLESRCIDALRAIESLLRERDELLAEVNSWRRTAGANPQLPKSLSNVAGLIQTEREMQRRAVDAHNVHNRRDSGQAGGPRDDLHQAATGTITHATEASHLTQLLLADPTQEVNPLSDLDDLLRDTSWSQATQTPMPAFPAETSLARTGDIKSMRPTIPQAIDPLPESSSDANSSYKIFGDADSTQETLLLSMDSIQFPIPDDESFALQDIPLSPGYLPRTVLDQAAPLQQSQQWVSWNG